MSSTLIYGVIFGIVGGIAARYFKLPGGAFIGSMLGCAIYSSMIRGGVVLPINLKLSVQIAAGILIGTTAKRDLFEGELYVFVWAFVGAFSFLFLGLILAFIAIKMGHLDTATAVFGFTPGGLTGMAVVADEEGANASQVVLMHFTRVFLLFLTIPFIVRWLLQRLSE